MQEIITDVFENINKFDLVVIPCSQFLKKTGDVCIDKKNPNSTVAKLFKKIPSLSMEMGNVVETYGSCPFIFHTVLGTTRPCKLATFPTTPSAQSIRPENREKYILPHLVKGMKGSQTLVPGWMMYPRSDIVEFSCIKLAEVIRWYKLRAVVLPWDGFNIPEGDRDQETRIKSILNKYLPNEVFLSTLPKEEKPTQSMVTSTVEYDDAE